jgi:peptide/nickel transport system substrate-binding protein
MMGSLLDASGEPKYPDIKTIKNLTPSLQMAAVHFTFTINAESPYIGNGQFPNGIPTDFFNNTHARRAFAYAFNRTRYVGDVYGGEALWPQTPLIEGLSPDYRTGVTGYDADFASAEAELKQALFNGTSVWETGFSLAWLSTTLSGPDYVYQNLHDFFSALSTYDGRPPEWPDFVINIVYIIWSDYLARLDNFELPMWTMGWISDFSDADNFMRPYVYSKGDFPKLQNYTAANGWGPRKDELVDVAVRTYDGPNRAAMYGELEQTYINDCPSFPIAQPLGRRWSKYWVRGWYYNVLCQSQDYYRMWKEDTCWYDIAGAEAAGQPGVSDGICNTRDITYLILRFEARPPSPVAGSDPKWVGTYGCGGVDPSGDRICNTRDITFAILHFNHKNQP